MSKWLKILLAVIGSLLILGIMGLFVANTIIKSKIETFLQKSLPENLNVQYSDVDVSAWNGRIILISPNISKRIANSKHPAVELNMDSLLIDGFGSWNYLLNKKINIESIQFRQPKLIYYQIPEKEEKEETENTSNPFEQDIYIKRLNIQRGDITIRKIETDSLVMRTKNFTANLMDIRMDATTMKSKIPFLYKDYNIHFDNLFYALGLYENVTIQSSKITNDQVLLNDLKLKTKYSKQTFNKMISTERDHFDIGIKSIVLKDHDFGFNNDSNFYFRSSKVIFSEPKMNIYRNKLIADDNTIKSLYSKMLRNLKFDLTLSSVLLENAIINYTEKVNADSDGGEINFSELNAKIANLSNTYKAPNKTTIDIDATFMKETPIAIEWYFDINDTNDHFIFKANMGRLNANHMNMFTEPNLNVRLEGAIHKTYFTIDGYDSTSSVDLKLNYDDFKVVVLQKNERKKNKFLSTIVNVFVKKDSDEDEGNFRNGYAEVERNKTKSIFNFMWLNASQGLLNAMTGSGKEKK